MPQVGKTPSLLDAPVWHPAKRPPHNTCTRSLLIGEPTWPPLILNVFIDNQREAQVEISYMPRRRVLNALASYALITCARQSPFGGTNATRRVERQTCRELRLICDTAGKRWRNDRGGKSSAARPGWQRPVTLCGAGLPGDRQRRRRRKPFDQSTSVRAFSKKRH
jgi:hypothetical protein